MARSKGGFFLDEKSKVMSHQYSLRLAADTNVWMTIEPLCIKPGGMSNFAVSTATTTVTVTCIIN